MGNPLEEDGHIWRLVDYGREWFNARVGREINVEWVVWSRCVRGRMVGYMYVTHSCGQEAGQPGKDRTYAGYAKFPFRRLRQHNREISGGARQTAGRRNWKFVCITRFSTPRFAKQAEWRIHRRRGRCGKGTVMQRRIVDLCNLLSMERVTSTAPLTAHEQITVFWNPPMPDLLSTTWPETVAHSTLEEFPEKRST